VAAERFSFLVCYDIRDPKRWRRAYKLLKGYGRSLQYSIFECRMTRRELERMRWELEKELSEEDSLMIAGLCSGCHSKIIASNTRTEWLQEEPRFRIIGAA
jgi:CRISPR-associated protein Cas2